MDKANPLQYDSLRKKSHRELVVIAAELDIPYRLEFPKAQLISMILKTVERLEYETLQERTKKASIPLAPHET